MPRQSFFLFGLRGVGKSTWVRRELPDAHRIDLLDESLYQSLLAEPGLFAAELRPLARRSWVVVDEVQRLPGLLNEVHRFIEERDLRFALLGSSARKLRTAGVNLLAGKALWREMFPLTPEELAPDFDLDRTLEIGCLPLVLASEAPDETLRTYVELYNLHEEIKGEALLRNLPGFARFLPVAALVHGQLVNVASIAREAGVARTTVTGISRSWRTRCSSSAYRPTRRVCGCESVGTPSSTGSTPASCERSSAPVARWHRRRQVHDALRRDRLW